MEQPSPSGLRLYIFCPHDTINKGFWYIKKTFTVLILLVIIGVIGVLVYKNLTEKRGRKISSPEAEISMPENLTGKKIAIIVALRDFRDEEYFVPKEILEGAGAEIKTVSTESGQAIGADGGQVKIDFVLEDLNVSDFDAVVFIGGPGALKYLDNAVSYKIAQETAEADKVLAAICVAPAILAKAGALSGKKATVWSGVLDKSAVRILEQNQAIYQDQDVVIDGKIVTANGPAAAENFARALIEVLK